MNKPTTPTPTIMADVPPLPPNGHLVTHMSSQTETMLAMVAGMISIRDRAEEVAKKALPEDLMLIPELDNFGESPAQTTSTKTTTTADTILNKIHSSAAPAKLKLDRELPSLLSALGADPDATATGPYKCYSAAPLKSLERCAAKCNDDYGGDATRLCDVARCSIVLSCETLLRRALENLLDPAQALSRGITVVRLKNRFKHKLFTGIRDCLLNVSIALPDGTYHIGEIQLHQTDILALKEESHI
jgi:hypothetical protein